MLNDVTNAVARQQCEIRTARYEKKFVVSVALVHLLEDWVMRSALGFRVAYPARQVSSVYFDNPHLAAYHENISGIRSRRKLRLRWYGEAGQAMGANLELKAKLNSIGWKQTEPIVLAGPLTRFSLPEMGRTIEGQISAELENFFALSRMPVLLTRYSRRYFVSANGRVRITIDNDLAFFDQRQSARLNTDLVAMSPGVAVMEMKYDMANGELGRKAADTIGREASRCSKYVMGVQAILRT